MLLAVVQATVSDVELRLPQRLMSVEVAAQFPEIVCGSPALVNTRKFGTTDRQVHKTAPQCLASPLVLCEHRTNNLVLPQSFALEEKRSMLIALKVKSTQEIEFTMLQRLFSDFVDTIVVQYRTF